MSLGTVVSNKDSSQMYQPLLLAALWLHGTSTPLLLSTHPLDGVSGPAFPGIGVLPAGNYVGRIAEQDIEALQQRSQLGIDRVSKFTLHLFDQDRVLYNTYAKVYGFRGATMQVALVLWQAGTTNFSSDAPIQFTGTCDMEVPQHGGAVMSVSANTGHNTGTVKLPMAPIQNRCILYFPINAAQRTLAVRPTSGFCPYSADLSGGVGNFGPSNHINSYGEHVTDGAGVFIMCDFIRSNSGDATSGCMARLGNAASTSVAPDGDLQHDTSARHTGAFAGIEWSPGTYYAINKNYTSNTKIATFSFLNSTILGQYHNLLYGTQWVNGKIANVIESGNDSKCEVMVCTGDIGDSGVIQVTVNGISLNRAPSGDNNLWWDFNNTGGRFGAMNPDSGYNKHGDPYGSIACLRTTFYKDIFTGFGTPTIRVLATGPQLWVYAPIQSITAGGGNLVITWPAGFSNLYISGPGSIIGNSNSALNVDVGVYTSFTSSTVTFSSGASGSGSGGFIGQLSNLVKSNPAWVLLDILLKANWSITEIDIQTFSDAAAYCDVSINYIDQSGNSASHARFKCQFALEQRKTAAEIISSVLRCFNGYLAWGQNGLLQLYINQTLADSQSSVISGSNYNTNVSSVHADGSGGVGHLAYLFDESNISRTPDGELDIEFEQNATVTTPNQIFINFQDEDNQFVDDSLGELDSNAVTISGGTTPTGSSLQPGGSLIPETLNVTGISNFDQATRISNVYMAERQYGNELNIPIGTRVMTLATTVRCEHLRVGHLVGVTLAMYGWTRVLFRVIKIAPTLNYQFCKLTLQWHYDSWYEDAYGQAPQAFYSSAGTNRPNRSPIPWQPFAEQPVTPSGDPYHTEWNFQVTEVDTIQANGDIAVQMFVSGKLPVNQIITTLQQPRVPVQGSTVSTGGTIKGGIRLLVEVCALDSAGNYSPHSGVTTIDVPNGTNTNTVTIANIGWPVGADGYAVFAGMDHYAITEQVVSVGSGTPPSSITLTSLPNSLTYAPPDLASGTMELKGKLIIHEGIIGEFVSALDAGAHTVTLGLPVTGVLGDLTVGSTVVRKLILIGRPNSQGTNLPIVEFNILSNTGSVLTVDRDPTADLVVGDVVVVSAQANINPVTASNPSVIGDTMLVNPYSPTGAGGEDTAYMVMIIRGTGRYQSRLITAVATGDTYLVDHPWTIAPDVTSTFIVVEKSWRYVSDISQVNTNSYTNQGVSLLNVDNYLNKPVLIMALVGDPLGATFASEYRSPFRMQWIFGVQGTRLVTDSGSHTATQLPTDLLVSIDTTGTPATTDTLGAAITVTTTPTAITLTSGAATVNGTYIQVDSEIMYILDGGTTSSLDVDRGQMGTTAATHLNGATVHIPGAFTFQLLELANIPNQGLIITKTNGPGGGPTFDLSYVDVKADAADDFSGGVTDIILSDNTDSRGTLELKAPGAE